MKQNRCRHFFTFALLSSYSFLSIGCSSTPLLLEKYRLLSLESKRLFIANYPSLRPSQRIDFLEEPGNPAFLLNEWKILPQKNQKLSSIEIQTDPLVSSGSEVPLKAFAIYENGKKLDVTRDVQWQAFPETAKIRDSRLTYTCGHSDIYITANFFDQTEGKFVLQLRKPLREIKIQVADSAQSFDQDEHVELKLSAYCQDGSSEEVSCQASWKVDPSDGKVLGCGYFHLSPKALKKREAIVRASYGGSQISQKILLPPRVLRN